MAQSDPITAAIVDSGDAAWQQFVLTHPDALPYHHPAWVATIADAYGYEPFAAVVRAGSGEILGGAPFVTVGGRVRARRWVSLPFTDVCPPLRSSLLSANELRSAVEALQLEHDVAAAEIRARLTKTDGQLRGVTHSLELGDPDALFAAFKPQVRRNIRKAEASGVTVRAAEQQSDLARDYFALHADTRRRLGVPSQPRRFFEALWRHVIEPGLGSVLLAYHDGIPIAGAVFLEWNGRVVYKYGASDRRHWPLRPNNVLFWESIRRGCASGARALDFGRTDLEDEGLRTFKASWGALEEPLFYTTLGRSSPARSGLAGRLLRPIVRVAPTWVGRTVGAALYRFAA